MPMAMVASQLNTVAPVPCAGSTEAKATIATISSVKLSGRTRASRVFIHIPA